ncbi:hypothetical protein [Cysteiniphilum halobium]|uniref:hypothetical protein n=1 Tax=Cysteiniphilum halobium TaxID=2219059 RepID=UPI003F86205D
MYNYISFTGETRLDATAFSNCFLVKKSQTSTSTLDSTPVKVSIDNNYIFPLSVKHNAHFYYLNPSVTSSSLYLYDFKSKLSSGSSSDKLDYFCLTVNSHPITLSFLNGFDWVGSKSVNTNTLVRQYFYLTLARKTYGTYWLHDSNIISIGTRMGFSIGPVNDAALPKKPFPAPYSDSAIAYVYHRKDLDYFYDSSHGDFQAILNDLADARSGYLKIGGSLLFKLYTYEGIGKKDKQTLAFQIKFKTDPILSMESKFTTQVDFNSGTTVTVVSRDGKYAAYPVVKAQSLSTLSPPTIVPKGYVVYYKNKFDIANRDKQLSKNIKNITLNFNFTHDELNFYKHNYVCLVTLTAILTKNGGSTEKQSIAKGEKYNPTTNPQVFSKTLDGNPICQNAYDCQIKTELTCHPSNMPSTITKYDSKAVSMIDLYQGVYDAEN